MTAIRWPAWPLFCSLVLVFGCASPESGPGPDRDPRVLATVNGYPISVSWFEQTYIDFLVRSGSNDSEVARAAHLEQLIDAMLLAEHFDVQSQDTTADFIGTQERIKREELGSRFFETAFLDTMSAPTEGQLRAAYVRDQSKRVVRHLFFTSLQQAEASYQRLQEGVPFLEEAQNVYGLAEVDSMAGFLGAIGYYAVDDAFAETAFDMESRTYSEPVRTRYGYHIIFLEDIILEPLLTESAYLTRRSGLSSQYRQRRRRLEGDQFVRSFMAELDVTVNAPAVAALNDLISALDPTAEEMAGQVVSPLNDSWKRDVDPSTALLTFDWNGKREAFTAGDYAFWFASLPQREARERTAASVGRALRNEALFRAADGEGLRDREWEIEVQRRVRLEKARRMRENLRSQPGQIDSSLVKRAYERLGWSKRRLSVLSFDAITALTPEALQASMTRIGQWPIQYREVRQDAIPEWSPYVATAPVDSVIIVGRPNDWAAIRVLKRTRIMPDWTSDRKEIERQLRPFVAEYELVSLLRAEAEVDIDRQLMKEIASF